MSVRGVRAGWAALALAGLAACSSGTPQPVATPSPAPSLTPSPTPSPAPSERTHLPVTLAFGGDVHFEGVVRRHLLDEPATVLEPVARLLRGADIAMVNLETPVTDRGVAEDKDFVFRAPGEAFRGLLAAGVDVVTIANNHGMDYGTTGLLDTLEGARRARLPVVGGGVDEDAAYAPHRFVVRGERIAVFGATQVLDNAVAERWTARIGKPGLASAKRQGRLLRAVREAGLRNDTVVVYLHWGKEMSTCPSADQKQLAEALVRAGADVVVGSHAHVLQGSGWKGRAYVDYGLGNFLFYAGGSGPTTRTGVLQLTVRGHRVTKARWRPAVIANGRVEPLSGEAAAAAVARRERQRSCTDLAAAP